MICTHQANNNNKISIDGELVGNKIDKKKNFSTKNLIICRLSDIGQKGKILIILGLCDP